MNHSTQPEYIFTPTGFLIENTENSESEVTQDCYRILYKMGTSTRPDNLTMSGYFLYQVAVTFFKKLTAIPEIELARDTVQVNPDEETISSLLVALPYAIGAEFVNEAWIRHCFAELEGIFHKEIRAYDGTVELYLTEKNQNLHVSDRVFLHLVENKNADYPFAFLATYATKTAEGQVKHLPLQYALTEYDADREKLLALLTGLNRVAERSSFIAQLMESGEMFHPLRLTSTEAYEFLKDVEVIEQEGILCRIPDWWRKRSMVPALNVNLGGKKPSLLGFDALVSMQPSLMVDGTVLSTAEIQRLLQQTEGLALLKGKWVEVDHAKLRKLLAQMEEMPAQLSMMDALRLEMGSQKILPDVGAVVTNGQWLGKMLSDLQRPERIRNAAVPKSLHAVLRPYQRSGYTWLNYMQKLGFGACLADDMGLGKTVQVLAFLEKLRASEPEAKVLLVVPASLLGNWEKEAGKFAPGMNLRIIHGKPAGQLEKELSEPAFLYVTTYGMAARLEKLAEITWNCIILDEAQAIKNPVTKQTRAVKKLKAQMKIAMTGTPIENDLTNLWSLFDFLNHGLLGSSKEFHEFCKGLADDAQGYAKLKSMISPFLLRRVKTDKNIIADLPDKVETIDYASLSKKQLVLYRKTVSDMEQKIVEAEENSIERRGIVLAAIMKLKQICNHPDQYLGQSEFAASDSGKFALLEEICETIYEKRERVLVFTQFKEMTKPLDDYLYKLFHIRGYVIHGGTHVKKRTEIVEAFQGERYVPYIILSVKAAGTGLNLTKANHVIHFDRWWNPAVENQATDRAFRIGQTKSVMVHKLVSQGTIEEKIDAIINSKKELSENVIGSGGEKWITDLTNEELFSLLRLDS